MTLPRLIALLLLAGVAGLGAGGVCGQNYPVKPVRLVTSGIGGGSDFTSRLIAQGISGGLGVPLIVDNRSNGVVAGDAVSKASPDGYSLLVSGGTLWIGALLQKRSYDAVADFSPVSAATSAPNLLVTHPSLPVKSVKELIALAETRPGALNYSSAATGSSTHLAAELFKAMARVDIVHISYKGSAPAISDLMGGHVQLMFATAASVASQVSSGRLRALAVTSTRPSALAPGLPTVAASGLPGYESISIDGVFVPARTPAPIIDRLNREIVRFLNTPEAKDQFLKAGAEAIGSSPESLAAAVKDEISKLGKVIRDAGIRAD